MAEAAAAEIERAMRKQARTCGEMGSAIYADLLARSADDFAAGGAVARALAGWEGHPVLDNSALRLLGALHFLALRGDAPALAAHYPSCGGRHEPEGAWRAFQTTLEEQMPRVRQHLTEQIQTNEVRRCCALVGGFLAIARAHALPLRLLEIGSSAGLNLCFDRYRYELGALRLGLADAPLALASEWRGSPLAPSALPRVASRAGCDVAPIDLASRDSRLRLESFFWADQTERLERVRTACACAIAERVHIERERAGSWLERSLAELARGQTTVLFHSVMWTYVPADERTHIGELIEAAGARAASARPFAWLRMEGVHFDFCEIRLRLWPGGDDQLLGRCHYHGAWVEWLGGGDVPTWR